MRLEHAPPGRSGRTLSRYNFWGSTRSGAPLLFNGLTGALIELNALEASRVRAFADCGQELEPGFAQDLAGLGFLVPVDADEVEVLQRRAAEGCRAGSGRLELVISPTYACNFRCTYCYVDAKPGAMNRDVEMAIVRHVESMLDGYSLLEVSWFGGEPLLCVGTLERVTRDLRGLARTRGVEFRAFATTNGYLLDTTVVRRLVCQ